ncbi:formyltetrahydrofolate deformylase [Phycisphaera mikurensis]|uniref:Formyltetrahydrofolate deformylase n=1 Tax=Phycisphaera mikurensis (strain NBRC 102666 / KCTC 22515 / FYK2301M01) TaxID=1142394 RepID=I0IBR3_PHYMF|nr:formyltetrahydrofolate deformylase [Phycisphaera mikurensis]MBB6442067.1 formyltetrahydrofolate deformylase [Phycisphaera mikurensis]BAM02701.1 formyltetrahydrofolate deformylase [Phycisphaera mikurensis NBRC 102666]
MNQIRAVISVSGQDQKGVVARFATYLAGHGVNILDLEQQVAGGRFLMDMLVDLAELDPETGLERLIPELVAEGGQIGMDVRVALASSPKDQAVAVLVSKEQHCLDVLIDRWEKDGFRGRIACVLGNHPDLQEVAAEAGLPFAWKASTDKAAHFAWLGEQLQEHGAATVVLARYMQIVPPDLVAAYPSRIINIHPSLLPHFPGANPYRRAWEAGARVAGCTAHYVTEQLDEGPIILQDVFPIDVGRDGAEDVRAKGQKLEGRILAEAVRMHLDAKLVVVDGKVVFRPGLSAMLA